MSDIFYTSTNVDIREFRFEYDKNIYNRKELPFYVNVEDMFIVITTHCLNVYFYSKFGKEFLNKTRDRVCNINILKDYGSIAQDIYDEIGSQLNNLLDIHLNNFTSYLYNNKIRKGSSIENIQVVVCNNIVQITVGEVFNE